MAGLAGGGGFAADFAVGFAAGFAVGFAAVAPKEESSEELLFENSSSWEVDPSRDQESDVGGRRVRVIVGLGSAVSKATLAACGGVGVGGSKDGKFGTSFSTIVSWGSVDGRVPAKCKFVRNSLSKQKTNINIF